VILARSFAANVAPRPWATSVPLINMTTSYLASSFCYKTNDVITYMKAMVTLCATGLASDTILRSSLFGRVAPCLIGYVEATE